ncbi:MAG: hypothetical protein KC800_05575 [Candidatus Eremiobacteraeota bacterium]|nr:hypothetical protein [Candidatus Eremiobacteraeota bacterium]
MQIQSSKRPVQAQQTLAQPQTKEAQEQKVFKPFQESWQIGEDTYASTADLVQANGHLDNVEAVYRFQTEETPAPFTKGERIKNAAGTAIAGAATGAVGGAVVGAGLAILDTAGDILGGFMGGRMNGTSAALVFVPVAIGAAIGAGIGGTSGYKMDPAVSAGEVRGILSKTENGTAFFPNGQVDQKIDLNTFKNAPVPDVTPEQKPESKPVRNALIGAAAGAAVVPGAFIPLAGLFGPALIGSKIGESLDKRTALGGGLGLLGGAAATGAGFYALSQVTGYGPSNYLPLIAVASTLGVAGAVLGDKVLTSMSTVPAHRDYGQQWWSQHAVKEQQA